MLNRLIDILRPAKAKSVSAPLPAAPANGAVPLIELRARLERNQREDTIAACTELHRLANIHHDNPDVLALYGWALLDLSEFAEARGVIAEALRQRPNHPEALNAMGALAAELDDPLEAAGWFEDVLALSPEDPAARYNLAQVLFPAGQVRRGFDLLRARRMAIFGNENPMAPLPMWQGESLEGKHVLVWCDWGGLGDHLQFARYVPMLRDRLRPAQVTMGAAAPFTRLFGSLRGVDGYSLPGQLPRADVHVPLLDLPHVFGTDLDSVPWSGPYLSALPEDAANWAAQLEHAGLTAANLRAGLAWKSTGPVDEALVYRRMRESKSIPSGLLEPLAASGARFVSLQVGADGLECAQSRLPMFYCAPSLTDFAATAAVIANLDIVVSTDTSVAHLAGAMGKPVLLLLRRQSGMFWLHGREDSPWYPSLRILRQQTAGDWAAPIAQAAAWLERAAKEGAAVVAPG